MSVETPKLIFGTAGLSALPSHHRARRLLEEAEACGIHHFDTAPIYGRGYAEWILGLHLARTRSRALVTTKFGLGRPPMPRWHPSLALPMNHLRKRIRGGAPMSVSAGKGIPYRRITRQEVEASLQESMTRLGRRHIDVCLLHEGLPSFLEPQALDLLMEMRQRGSIGRLGLGTNAEVLMAAQGEDYEPFDILQYEAGPCFTVLQARYPAKEHVLHSCFRGGGRIPPNDPERTPPLAYWSGRNPDGRLIFFTSRLGCVRENVLSCS